MNARETILRRVREAIGEPGEPVTVPRGYLRTAPDVDPDDRAAILELFEQRLERYGAQVLRTTPAGVATVVDRELRHAAARVVLTPPGLPDIWTSLWADRSEHRLVTDDPPLTTLELDEVDAVVTTCAAAIAQSGTIILDGDAGQGRRAPTLVPDRHVCVVHAEQVKSALPEVVPRLDPRRPTTWISGPSATVDIEMTRVQGVHGPRRLIVILVE